MSRVGVHPQITGRSLTVKRPRSGSRCPALDEEYPQPGSVSHPTQQTTTEFSRRLPAPVAFPAPGERVGLRTVSGRLSTCAVAAKQNPDRQGMPRRVVCAWDSVLLILLRTSRAGR